MMTAGIDAFRGMIPRRQTTGNRRMAGTMTRQKASISGSTRSTIAARVVTIQPAQMAAAVAAPSRPTSGLASPPSRRLARGRIPVDSGSHHHTVPPVMALLPAFAWAPAPLEHGSITEARKSHDERAGNHRGVDRRTWDDRGGISAHPRPAGPDPELYRARHLLRDVERALQLQILETLAADALHRGQAGHLRAGRKCGRRRYRRWAGSGLQDGEP